MMSFMSIQGSRQHSMIFFYAGYLNISAEWIILDNSNHSSTESFCIVWGRLMASEKQYLILLQWNTSEANRASESDFDLRTSLQKNNVKIGFTSLLVFCSVVSIEKNASAVGRRIETAYFVSCWSHLMILRSSHNYHQLPKYNWNNLT